MVSVHGLNPPFAVVIVLQSGFVVQTGKQRNVDLVESSDLHRIVHCRAQSWEAVINWSASLALELEPWKIRR
jgi:hypothetical protein